MGKLLYWLHGKPTHCAYCGHELSSPDKVPIKHDRRTGKPIKYSVVVSCPWFGECTSSSHDYYRWTEKVK